MFKSERRTKKKKRRVRNFPRSGGSVFKLLEIIIKKAKKRVSNPSSDGRGR